MSTDVSSVCLLDQNRDGDLMDQPVQNKQHIYTQ